ncbi:hypothetical protein BK816_08105 [Boudabousia tangfeifanii]|uniref:CAAX prenyl protease 2/Lysostaphin resistance protein A-like domain-containing protein n=1 Tax=Boudabousia tangfeifanii TaxID=1912795 RepID=A0A1D9MLJ5_9ACTO|nr:type II CAAX endopeptidase family protein [Boudabousia tangfeifanii]AOZ73251.1 hypothetical protein BK816_08105 [Boudabousia tangfeifanii]
MISLPARRFSSPILVALLCALVVIGTLALSALALSKPLPYTATNALSLLITLAVTIVVMWQTGTLSLLGFSTRGFSAFWTLGWPMLLMATVVATLALVFSGPATVPTIPVSALWFILGVALTATFEEALFRGTVLPLLLTSKQSTIGAVITSAVIFSVSHLLALLGGGNIAVVGTLTQVFYTFCMGVLLAAIMLTTQNLWVTISLHFVYNVLGDLGTLTEGVPQASTAPADMSLPVVVILVILAIPMLLVGLRTLKSYPKVRSPR